LPDDKIEKEKIMGREKGGKCEIKRKKDNENRRLTGKMYANGPSQERCMISILAKRDSAKN
jgi:hypothetical protein